MSSQTPKYEPVQVYGVDDEAPTSSRIVYKRYGVFSTAEWLMEMLTTIASLVLLALVVAIFWWADGKPSSAWTWPISINAAISVLTTLCNAALMHGVSEFISQLKWLHFKDEARKLQHLQVFDEASRGPWGSAKFLGRVRWNVATLGALITIARFGFSPLAQQVVSIEQRFVATDDDGAVFGYAHEYNRGTWRALSNSYAESVPQDPSMQAAIIQGFFNITTPATFSCPGACSWNESYVSLGFKSQCDDVTKATLATSKCADNPDNVVETVCNMTTPAGLKVVTRHVDTDSATSYYMNAASTMPTDVIALPDNFPKIALFAIYRATSDYNFDSHDVNITDCSLSLTGYRYTGARVNSSTFSFNQVREVKFPSKKPWSFDVYSSMSSMNSTISSEASKTADLPVLRIAWADLIAIQMFLKSDTINTEWVDGDEKNMNPGFSFALSGDVDLEARFQKMATSMTDYVRSGPNRIDARGQRLDNEPFVVIRWRYLIGPATIELMALVFAVVTILLNRKSRNVPLWKSSALAVLNCQYEREPPVIRPRVRDIKIVEQMAEKAIVKLD